MFSIRIELLTGVYSASAYDDRSSVEWPPHPGRLFSAMTAVWAEAGMYADERAGMVWLESQPPPQIACSTEADLQRRSVLTHFVPVNDPSGLAILPSERGLQPRTYPSVRPDNPVIHFCWPEADPDEPTLEVLEQILDRVWRLGHSSSLVSCRVVAEAPQPTLVPNDRGRHRIRVPTDDLLDALIAAHAGHRGTEPRVLPNWTVRYGDPSAATLRGLYDNLIPLRLADDRRLPVERSLGWCRAMRGALNSFAETENAFIAGHESDSAAPRRTPHPCFVPLVHCDADRADGTIHGFGVVLPSDTSTGQRLAIEDALDAWAASDRGMHLYTRGGRRVRLERVPADDRRFVLQPGRWSGEANTWATVTPMALDRFPDHLSSTDPTRRHRGLEEAKAIVVDALAHQGLPKPESITVSTNAPVITGSADARSFDRFRRGRNGPTLVKVHCTIRFAEPVGGPLVVGAGRHLGMGLMTPRRKP